MSKTKEEILNELNKKYKFRASWLDTALEAMESYATDRVDSYKEAQRQAIEERIQHLEGLMADSETGTEDWFKIGHLISEAKRNFSILLSVTPKE